MSEAITYNPTTVISMEGAPTSSGEVVLRWTWRIALVTLGLLVSALAILVARGELYTAGSDFGYNLGLVGGLLLLSLLGYSLRKRIRFLERLGAMNSWFRYHMFVGIGGPTLIVFHSTFELKSMNGSIAFLAMVLVVVSGIAGRFIYRHVHRGLYGRKLSLASAREDIQASILRLGAVFSLQNDIESRLGAFHDYAFAPSQGFFSGLWRFVTLQSRAQALSEEIRHEVKKALVRHGRETTLPSRQVILEYRLAKGCINGYFDSVVRASQLSSWERAFSLWHLIHVPFLYLLVISGIVHVIAVHMY
jgi:hypothetical protein